MKNRISRIRTSAQATLVAGFCFACSQTPPAEAPEQPEPAPVEPAPAAAPEPPPPPPGPVVIKANGKLYVADIDVIRTFDAVSGKPGQQIKVTGAGFLNDVAVAPDGTVYVSDTGLKAGKDGGLEPNKKDAIYKVSAQGKVSPLIKGEQLGLPNGLFADATGLWVATWQGALYHVTPDGKQEAPLKAPGAQLDGLTQTAEGQVLFSSWEKSTVYIGSTDGQFSPLLSDVKAPADIGYDSKRGQVLVPSFTENTVSIMKLPAAASAAQPAATNATAEVK